MTYIELDGKLIEKLEKETCEKFNKKGNLIPVDEIETTFEDLLYEIDKLTEQLEDEVEKRENYWKPKSHLEIEGTYQYGPIGY